RPARPMRSVATSRRIAVRFLFRLILFAAGAALAYQLVGRASGAYARTTCPHCGSSVGVFFPLEGMEVYCDSCNQPMVINKAANRWTAEAVSEELSAVSCQLSASY